MLCYAMLCYAMLCYAMLCYDSYYITLHDTTIYCKTCQFNTHYTVSYEHT